MSRQKKFKKLAIEAINSGRLSSDAVSTLKQVLRVREASTEIDIFADDIVADDTDAIRNTKANLQPVDDSILYKVHLLINNKLNPDVEQNKIAAASSARNDDPISNSDLSYIFGKKIKYVSLEHLEWILEGKTYSYFCCNTESDAEIFDFIKNKLNGKAHCTMPTLAKWRQSSESHEQFLNRIAEHIFYWSK